MTDSTPRARRVRPLVLHRGVAVAEPIALLTAQEEVVGVKQRRSQTPRADVVDDESMRPRDLIEPVVLRVAQRIEPSRSLCPRGRRRSDRGSAHQTETKLGEERTPCERERFV